MENILDCNWKIRNKWSRYLTWSEHSAVSDRTKAYNSLREAHNKETNPQMEQSLLKNRAAAMIPRQYACCIFQFSTYNSWKDEQESRPSSHFHDSRESYLAVTDSYSCLVVFFFFTFWFHLYFLLTYHFFLTWVHPSSLPKRKKKQPRRCLAKLSTSTSVGVHVRVQWAYPAPEIALPCPVALTLPSDGR